MFSHHLLEFFDRFERHVVLSIAKIHERAGVNTMLRHYNLNRTVGINLHNGRMLATGRKRETQAYECDGYIQHRDSTHSNLDVRWKPTVFHHCTRSRIS